MKAHLEARERQSSLPSSARLWFLPLGDKAHAWNTYVHELWPMARTTVFIDGYVEVAWDAIQILDDALSRSPNALAATGVPSVGLSSKALRQRMISGGGIHGNLYALSDRAMMSARHEVFRMPLGLYRTDPMLGAMLRYRFRPDLHDWDMTQVIVAPLATWSFEALKWWKLSDLKTHFRRYTRQGQGQLENLAFRHAFRNLRKRANELPASSTEMIQQWITSCPSEASNVMKRFSMTRHSFREMQRRNEWSKASDPAVLLFDSTSRKYQSHHRI